MLGEPIAKKHDVPAHVQVRERLLGLIRAGELRIGQKLPSEPDIAEALGVSRMTANKAILALVREGWIVREKGRGSYVSQHALRQARSHVCVLFCESPEFAVDDHYHRAIYQLTEAALNERGARASFGTLDDRSLETCAEADGLIVVSPPKRDLPQIAALSRHVGPTVILGASWDSAECTSVDSDNVLGTLMAVQHLVGLGHTRLLFVGSNADQADTVDRIHGFKMARHLHGIDPRESWLVVLHNTLMEPGNEKRLTDVLQPKDRPTAVIAAGASLAMLVTSVARKIGLSVPEELSVVGYDDPPFMSLAYPPFTTVRQPLAEMATAAVEELLARIAQTGLAPVNLALKPELVFRGSSIANVSPMEEP